VTSPHETPITVVIVISNLEFGGAQRQVVELANRIDRETVTLHIVSLSSYIPLASQLRAPEDRVHIIEKKSKFDISVVPRLARLLRRLRADVVHGYLFDAEIAARLAGFLARTPATGGCERNTNYELKKIQLLAYRMTKNLVDFYVANSVAGARFNCNTLGHPENIYYVVHNGVDTNRFCPRDKQAIRSELGIDTDTFVVGMFGSFKPQKNHALLFESFSRLRKSVPNSRMLLVGDELAGGMHGSTEYRDEMKRVIVDLELSEYCILCGNRANVESLYPACDVTALPSLFEGTPNVALESMACAVPVVATDVSDNAYIIRDGETGYLVDVGDIDTFSNRLQRLADDRRLADALGVAGRQWMVDEFSTTRLADKTVAVYLDTLGLDSPNARQLKRL
jgi:glycosyltransferase involved in cell wall biosynthesis